LSQKHNFKIEFVIGDDCSKDRTRDIIRKYDALYPGIFVMLFPEKNQGSEINTVNCLDACKGKYIAFLEGDDYWTDPYKLQKQVDFLEANPDFSLCFTRVNIIDDIGLECPDPYQVMTKDEFTMEDIVMAERSFIPTPTLVFRNVLPNPSPKFLREAIPGDYVLHLLLADKGKIKCLPGKTAVYRQHAGGVTKSESFRENEYDIHYALLTDADKYFEHRYTHLFKKRLLDVSKTILIFGSRNKKGFEKVKHTIKNFPKYIKSLERINIKEILYYLAILYFPSVLKRRAKSK
jgi:glycosyltransferase involved in cell wall biosynthesis